MASLTEVASEAKGKTVLYIPVEDVADTEAAAKQKDLVQRLNSTLIHWTRQASKIPWGGSETGYTEGASVEAKVVTPARLPPLPRSKRWSTARPTLPTARTTAR
eukprot:scaffold8907_cov105-Isochrysis_galbana.AAC.8